VIGDNYSCSPTTIETRGLRGFTLVLEVGINLSGIEWIRREQNQRRSLAHREPERSKDGTALAR